MQYKVKPLKSLNAYGNSKIDEALSSIGNVIQSECTNGWEFYGMYDVPISVKSGCFASIFGRKSYNTNHKVLVFVREDA